MTSGTDVFNRENAWKFCKSQHSTGLVTWDTEEIYRDIKFIVNKDGENSKHSHTAIVNKQGIFCDTTNVTCDGKLVSCGKNDTFLKYVTLLCIL